MIGFLLDINAYVRTFVFREANVFAYLLDDVVVLHCR